VRQTQRTLGAVLATTDPFLALGAGLFTLACGLAPDIDSYVPDRILEHRGLTYTVVAAGWLALASAGLSSIYGVATPGFAAVCALCGVLSHLAADALNPAGIRPFVLRPSREYALDICRASNDLANRLLVALGGVLTVLAIGALVLPLSIPSLSITTNSPRVLSPV
jgi:inner membrane protein